MIQVRHAFDSDAVWLTRLVSDPCFYRWMGDNRETKDLLCLAVAKKFELYRAGLGCVLIAHICAVPLGYGAYFYSTSSGHAYVECGVTPMHFGRGIGGRLLDSLIASAKGKGARGFQTLCHSKNVASIALLESRRFIRCENLSHPASVFEKHVLSFDCLDMNSSQSLGSR